MKSLALLVAFFLSGTITAQPLSTDEAYFFAEQLHSREVLSDYGYLVLKEEIREGRLAKRSQLLDKKFGIAYGELRVSSLLGFLSHVYREEEHWRTAYPHVAKLAQTFFGDPPPVALSPEQSNKLLVEARKRFGNMYGPLTEIEAGGDPFADNSLPSYFMQFAGNSYHQPNYKPLLYAGRSVTGTEYTYTAAVLKELGLVSAENLAQIDLSDFPQTLPSGQFYFNQLGTALADRENYPERAAENKAFLQKAVALGLLDEATAAQFKADSSVIGGGSRLPFYQAFIKRQTTIKIDRPMTYATGLPKLFNGIQSLSLHFDDAQITYKFTPNNNPPQRQYADGDDLTVTLTVGEKTYKKTTRRGRPYPGQKEPILMVNEELLGLFSQHLSAVNQDLMLFSIRNFDRKEQTITLLLLSDAEARSLMEWTMFDMIGGPKKYLQAAGF